MLNCINSATPTPTYFEGQVLVWPHEVELWFHSCTEVG